MPAASACSTKITTVRQRTDLVVSSQQQRGERVFVVKDPLALKYYRFSEVEYAILRMLDGRAAVDVIVRRITSEFPEKPIAAADIEAFVTSLYANSLVIGQSPEQGRRLMERRDAQRRQKRRRMLTSVLAIRCPGIDPTRLLDVLYPATAWFFGRGSIAGVGLLVVVALGLLIMRAGTLPGELVAMHEFFGPGNWLLLAITLAVTKMLHELGHALACRRCGGECHEIGVMFLVLTPCLYCDVSDSWLLPSKWQRAAIAAAGMYVEVTRAALATIVWSHSEPGTLHFLALQVMLVCSVSTLLFNGNPLARYDGYFILADLVEVPNLREGGRVALSARLWSLCGIKRRGAPQDPSWKLTLFGLCVVLYRWLLLTSILWVLHKLLAARGLEVAWQCITLSIVCGVVVAPAWRLIRAFQRQEVIEAMNHRRLLVVAAVLLGAVAFVLLVPLPRKVAGTFETRHVDAAVVYAPYAGSLQRVYVEPGQKIVAGELLAELRSEALDLEIARLQAEVQSQQFALRALQYERFQNPQAIEAVGQASELLAATQSQLAERLTALEQLRLVAPRSGTVLPPVRRTGTVPHPVLASWSGTPLDARNRAAPLAQGDIVCEIGDPEHMEAVLVVDQADVETLARGQHVELVLDAEPLRKHRGKITEIALETIAATPSGLSVQAGGQVPSHIDRAGVEKPASPSFSVVVSLDGAGLPAAAGMRGTARVHTGRETLAVRAWRFARRTFRFEW